MKELSFYRFIPCLIISSVLLISACSSAKRIVAGSSDIELSKPLKREFRGVWVASVANIDFPSASNLHSQVQREEFMELLELHSENNMNAIVMQVRPAGDALYPSLREPWSEFLTGKVGEMPYPYYDPLAFMIEQSHKKAMEFHAWFNPFRAVFDLRKKEDLPEDHIYKKHPEWFLEVGNQLVFNPGEPKARQFVRDIITEVVMRYDIDGVHLDDYFYPYPDQGKYNDSLAYQKYGAQKFNSIADWRRDNINVFVRNLSSDIKKVKPFVKFGISPCAVWRNKKQDERGSDTKAIAAYDDLYADTRLWLEQRWIDYIAPQVYFSTRSKAVPYEEMVNWWENNSYGRHVYVGHALYKIKNDSDSRWNNPSEMSEQIRLLREAKSEGSVFYRSKFLEQNPAHVQDSLKANLYRFKALPPIASWIDKTPPASPTNLTISGSNKGALLHWQTPKSPNNRDPFDAPAYYIVYRFDEGEKIDIQNPAYIKHIVRQQQEGFYIDPNVEKNKKYVYLVTAVDRLHNESQPAYSPVFKYKKSYLK